MNRPHVDDPNEIHGIIFQNQESFQTRVSSMF